MQAATTRPQERSPEEASSHVLPNAPIVGARDLDLGLSAQQTGTSATVEQLITGEACDSGPLSEIHNAAPSPRSTQQAGGQQDLGSHRPRSSQETRQLSKHSGQIVRKHAKLASLRSQELSLRDQKIGSTQSLQYKAGYFEDSVGLFMGELTSLVKQLQLHVFDPLISRLHERYQQVLDDRRIMDEETAALQTLDSALTGVEHRVSKREDSLVASTNKFLDLLQQSDLAALERPDLEQRHGSDEDSLSLVQRHPLLDAYLESVGNVKILRERLDSIVIEFEESAAARNYEADQGLPLEIADEKFQSDFVRDYTVAETALTEGIEAERHTRRACLDNGVDLQGFDRGSPEQLGMAPSGEHPDPLDPLETLSSLNLDDSNTPQTAGAPDTIEQPSATGSNLVEEQLNTRNVKLGSSPERRKQRAQARVEHWVTDINPEDAERFSATLARLDAEFPAMALSSASTRSSPTIGPSRTLRDIRSHMERAHSDDPASHGSSRHPQQDFQTNSGALSRRCSESSLTLLRSSNRPSAIAQPFLAQPLQGA